jgi:hypothetical protein
MSRLRRLVLLDRFVFLTVKLLPKRRLLDAENFFEANTVYFGKKPALKPDLRQPGRG